MGVTLSSKKGKLSIDMGYGGFYNLRMKVAELANSELRMNYYIITNIHSAFSNDKERTNAMVDAESKINSIINRKLVSYKIVDFLFQSDCEGKIHYGACKELLKVIGDYDDNIIYGYAGRPDRAMFKDFKAILQECVDLKCDLIWW